MYSCGPSIESGYRGSRKNAALEEFIPTTNHIKTSNIKINRNNNFGRTTQVATNLKSYFSPLNKEPSQNQDQGQSRRKHVSARDRHSIHGSSWSNSEAIR
jgi:hypothetical protein